jgi:hypothetical protein
VNRAFSYLLVAATLSTPVEALAEIDHSKLGMLLSKHVSAGRVDYEGVKKDREILAAYLKSLENAKPSGLADTINAYNALVIAALVEQPALPRQVIDLKGFFDAKKHKVFGKEQTLNDLENGARASSKDARVHFAFNCGAKSCPPLPSKPFDDATLDATLTQLTQSFFNGGGLRIADDKRELQVTKLMDWYKQDFVENTGSLEAYLKKFVTGEKRKQLEKALADGYKISFQDYNWEPNRK